MGSSGCSKLMDDIMSPICRHRPGLFPGRGALVTIATRCAAVTALAIPTLAIPTLAIPPLTVAAVVAIAALAVPALAQQPAAAPRPAPPKPATDRPATGAQAAAVAPGPGEPTLLAQFGEWGAYTAMPSGKKVCFALAKPVSSSTVPPNRPRDPAWMFISTRPSEKVTNEVSVTFGYALKPNTDASMEIGGASYAMNTQGDGAWVKNPAEETKLIDILRKGADVTIKGTSAKGTVSTDVFSLKGLSQALDKIGRECRT
jgi:invasion protein IalB